MACVPKSQGTPGLKNGKQGYITDYVPTESPMLPALIVHCVNEVCQFDLSTLIVQRNLNGL